MRNVDTVVVGYGSIPQGQNEVQIPNTLTVAVEIGTRTATVIFVEIECATNALAAFEIEARCSSDAPYVPWFSAAVDYTSPVLPLRGCSSDLTTLGAGQTGWFILEVDGVESVRIKATSGNVAGSTLTFHVGGN